MANAWPIVLVVALVLAVILVTVAISEAVDAYRAKHWTDADTRAAHLHAKGSDQ